MADFASDYYKDYNFYEIAKKHYEPFRGELAKSLLNATKDILKIIAYIGGQWPHTSHMVPGGLSGISDDLEILRIRYLIIKFKEWLENDVFLASLSSIKNIKSYQDLELFVQNNPKSHISILFNISKETDLFDIGKTGYGFLNFGSIQKEDGSFMIPQGYYENTTLYNLDLESISEDVAYSWYDGDATNPMVGKTVPNVDKEKAYSFTKAPRYKNKPIQTGPLGEELAIGNKLFKDLYTKFGDSVFVREFSRMLRPLRYIEAMEKEVEDVIRNLKEPIYQKPKIKKNATGIGLTHAARGVLGHWVKIKNNKIENYQIISPTTWNGSPKDGYDNFGAWEKALIGLKIKDTDNPMEMGHVIRSFDPCLVCTVHFIGDKEHSVLLKV
jgi:hydrogenase large subunit